MSGTRIEPGALKKFFIKVNTDAQYRLEFLHKPIETFMEAGIVLESARAEEVKNIIKILLESLPGLADIPTGYGALLLNVKAGKLPAPSQRIDDDPLIQ